MPGLAFRLLTTLARLVTLPTRLMGPPDRSANWFVPGTYCEVTMTPALAAFGEQVYAQLGEAEVEPAGYGTARTELVSRGPFRRPARRIYLNI